jgi:hypothetical protein
MPTGSGPSAVDISKNLIRERAAKFSKNWAGVTSEQAEKQTFWNELLAVFGIERRQVAAFEQLAERASTGNIGWIDLLYPGQMAVEHKSEGNDLDKAMGQLLDYVPSLHKSEFPWLLVVCDFGHFVWRNLETGQHGRFTLAELPDNLHLFWWMAGHGTPQFAFDNEEDANLLATALMAKLHDGLLASGYDAHALREWLTRILFCLFADDTEVWDRAAFHAYLARNTRFDGTDLGPALAFLFQVLNTPPEQRPNTLDEDVAAFTYINGDLFEATLPIPACNESIRTELLDACRFDWSVISPAIFGSMFQNVMTPTERRQLGAHYTTEENILKTIRPLFVDDLEAQLSTSLTTPALNRFHDRLATLRFLDPACGCGNFLVIAYREIRRLETEALRQLARKEVGASRRGGQRVIGLNTLCKVTVDQFYGIEIDEWPARIARTALYLIDHIANREVSAEFGEHYVRFPIPAAPHIAIGNALLMDWADLLPAERCDYVFGNPPFGGHTTRSKEQSDELRLVWGAGYAKWLDYVTGWYRRAIGYDIDRQIRFAFVSTNSISQGEQVARLWQPLLDAGYGLDFAHQTFAWTSEAKGKAHVHVVIEGFSHGPRSGQRLFTYATPKSEPVSQRARNISPYLIEGPDIAVSGRSTPLSSALPPVRYGSLPSDGGGLVVQPEEFPHGDLVAEKYLKPYVGSDELVKGLERWVIWMPGGPDPGDVSRSTFLHTRLEQVRVARLASKNPDTQALADQPYKWFHNAQPQTPYIGIPAQVSETRKWYTVAYLTPDVIASNTLYTAEDPDGFLFGILSSTMFMAWIRTIGGRLESRLRYSKSVVHNTFPLPTDCPDDRRRAVVDAGRAVLAAREQHGPATLSQLYEPLSVPENLVRAHGHLDNEVDAMFSPRRRFADESVRLSFLIERYEQLSSPLLAAPPKVRKRK